MSVIEEHETRLNNHDVKLDAIDVKVDVIDSTTKGTASAVGTLIKKRDAMKQTDPTAEGTINTGNWRGTLSSILATLFTGLMTAWSLWAIMYGDVNPFLSYLSIVCQPMIYVMIKTITGLDMKNMGLNHNQDLVQKEKAHKAELDKMAGVLQMKTVENYGLKEKIARLETKEEIVEKIGTPISAPKLPPQ